MDIFQVFVIGVILIGFFTQALVLFLKWKYFKVVHGSNPKKYLETKILERQFKVNRAMGTKEKNEA